MKPNNIEDIYPLTPMQQGILFHTLVAASPETYLVQIAWTLRGPLDVPAFHRAWQEIVDRHPALRTAFAWEKLDAPVQIVWKRLKLPLAQLDLRDLPAAERAERVRRFAEDDRRKGFDPTRAPLIRLSLLRLADDTYRFIWSTHHLLFDGWSSQLLVKELWSLYEAHAHGGEPRLPLTRPVSEYITWLGKQDPAGATAFWRAHLADFSAPTPLGIDHAFPAAEPLRFGERRRAVSPAATAALVAFARQHQLTMSTVLHGAWALLLSRYGREQDVVFGSTVSGRSAPVPGIDTMIGLFINTLAVRVRVDPAAPVLGFLTALQGHEAELRDHEHSALAEVQGFSGVPRGTPLFESLVVFENFPLTEPPAPGGEGGGPAIVDAQVKEQPPYPLTLVAVQRRALDLAIGYDARRFDEAAIDRLLGHLETLLGGLVADPSRRVGALPLLTAGETQRILVEWNQTAVPHPAEMRLHRLVEAQVDRTPDAPAVSFEGRTLTYRELDEQANRVAHRLQALGVGPDVLVGVSLERSLELPAALLGVLKAGGAYVPIDPSYPRDRVDTMLDDARPKVVLTQERLRAGLAHGRAHVIAVDADPELAAASAARPSSAVGPEHLAYVIYTSGSTGRPKGVMIPHRAIANHMRWMHRAFPLGASQAVLQKTPASFDASVWEFWLPLMGGARLVMARPDGHRDGAYLVQAIVDNGVTELQLVPSMLEVLLLEPDLERCVTLRRLFVGGEALSRSLVDRFKARRDVEVINLYGPTECAVQTVVWVAEPAARGVMEPIGRPIDNTRLYILDEALAPVPVGVAGELHIGGPSVGRGYLGRPDLTVERFHDDPFEGRGAGKLYSTGDLCRYAADGVVEYLGRLDAQVKLRGFRIELGEIEAVLGARPEIVAVAVVVREDAPGDRRLVAYVVSATPPSPSELRAYLAERLPEHMVPSAYVALEALPITPSGKLDRRALPAPEASGLTRDHVPPRGPVEEALAGVFAEVLKLPPSPVGAHDDFFALGGHSLLATQAVSRVRAAFGVELPIRAVFEAPTPAGLAARVVALLSAGALVPGAAPPIVHVERGSEVPLSFGQERMWFLAQLDPASLAYVIPLALRFAGALDKPALGRALSELVRRHEVLRTTFRATSGKPTAIVHPAAPIELPETSLAALPEAERERVVRAEAEAEGRRLIDLAAGPILRARLLELGPEDHVLLLTSHHIAIDAWTQGIINRELGVLYEAFVAGRPSPLPELPIQYGDYAAWQRAWLTGDVLARQLGYWRAQLAGAPASLDLPADRPRPPAQSHRGGQRSFTLSRELSAAVRELCRREGVTLYMALLAAFDVLLHRLTGQDDIVVGTPIAGRRQAETEQLVGLFLNTLVMRTRLSPELTFRELLARVKEACLGAYAHQDMPFERLVQELSPEPDPSRSPLFQIIFNLQNAPGHAVRLAGLELRTGVAHNATVKVDLTLIMVDAPDGLRGRFEYSADLFDAATVDRTARQLETLLQGLVKEPRRRLREIAILTEDERRRVLVAWNDTAATYGEAACYHELFEAQASLSPGALALVSGDARLTYAELDARANRLAHYLHARGVGPDVVVGLCLPRTADLVVALLGILKAGGAYLPLDPAYPARRLGQILGEAQASLVVTQGGLADRLRGSGCRVVRVDDEAAAIAAERDARPPLDATPSDLVYVLFTSGSTGAPKGVAVEHRQLVNYVRGIAGRLALPEGAAYAHVSTISADLGNTVLFPSLATGGALHLIAEELATDPDALGAYFVREGIDCLKIVPSHLAALLSGAHPERILPRRLLVLGGEASSWELVDRIERLAPGCRILNHYGPTEATVGVLTYPVGEDRPPTPAVPLGRPLPNSRVYVLDAQLGPAPVGVPGELYLGGEGIARGYLNQPELTRERFIKDPFSKAPGARLYRTGDRARTLPDGTLVFLGRVDLQVKIRGFRVELGEIEAALASYPALKEAVVAFEEASPGDKRLVAYVVPTEPTPYLAAARVHLEQRLPDYMIPSSFVVLSALPLTPNGKIDRRALAAVDRRREDAPLSGPMSSSWSGPLSGPMTGPLSGPMSTVYNPIQEVLAGIWADVFEREEVGIHERFTDLGGHSLLAIQIIARARDAFQVQIPLRAIFEAPTVESLGARIAAMMRSDAQGPAAPPITRVPRDGELPLSFAQERLWFLDRFEPGTSTYNAPSGLRLAGALDAGALERALREVLRRHEVLRTTFAAGASGQPVQIIHDALPFELPIEDLGHVPPAERDVRARARATAEGARPFDLARGPLLRARLLRLSPVEHLLVVTVHHIVSDARTQSLLRDEIVKLYDALRDGRPSPLAELTIQYADYAAWQRRWLAGDVLDKQVAYWKSRLAGAPPPLDLPADRPRPPVMTYGGSRRPFTVPAATKKALAELSRRESATLFMTLLAAFDVLLSRYAGQQDIVVGTPMTNRTRAETEGLIGFFLNTLLLRTQLADDLTFVELLGRVREACLGAYAHQDVPFERLVQALQPERDTSRTPLFQVMFTVQSVRAGKGGSRSGLRTRSVPLELGVAKFDLSLGFLDSPAGLHGSIEYRTGLFDVATIDRLAAHLTTLLGAISNAPEARLGDLQLLSDQEARTLLWAWNETRAEYPRDADLASLFEAQAARLPAATALTCGSESVTYGELDRRGNRVARALRRRGVRPGSLVGIAVERGVGMVVGLLGILKAGAAYLPLDLTYPPERLAFMAADAGLRTVVTEGTSATFVVSGHEATHLRLDVDAAAIEAESDAPLGEPVGPEAIAYVNYTSGSTGKPKGVEVPHRAVVNLLTSMRREPGLVPEDRLLAVTSLSFDIAGLELWLPLTTGAEVEIAPREVAVDGAALRRRLEQGGITVMQATPETWRMVVEAGFAGSPRLRILVGGEALPRDLADKLVERAASVWNMYGPTETTIWSCVHRVLGGDKRAPVLIGRPIANTLVYVLDAAQRLAPTGVPGELYLGGDGIARGYLGRPELTASRFVPNPFERGGRLYRTGDLCRFRADGALEFLGRLDHQIKLRGHRVELGEIEAVLEEQPGLRQAVVVVREDTPGDQRLVAYLAVEGGGAASPTVDALRVAVRARLPEIMVPSAFVTLDAMPLTPNGKVDRRALPAPAERANLAGKAATRPRDETEFRLAAIWRSVLGIATLGVHDSFFDLGGHSVLAVRMMAEVERAFAREIPLVALFEAQTIAKLAALLTEEGVGRRAWPALVPIRSAGSRRPLFLISMPNVNALGYIALVRHLDPEQPVYGLQMQYPEERELGRPYTVEERRRWMLTYAERLRAVQPEGPYLIAGMCEGALIAFDLTRHLEAQGHEVKLLAMIDTWPEENTANRFLHHVSLYERGAQDFFHLGRPRQLEVLQQRGVKALAGLRRLLRGEGGDGAAKPGTIAGLRSNPWDTRMFPGPSFVPPTVQVRIDVFRTRRQPYWRLHDRDLGWGSRTTASVDVHVIAGDHLTFMREEHVATLAHELQGSLTGAHEELERDAVERARRAMAVMARPAHAPIEVAGLEDTIDEACEPPPRALA